MHFLIASIFTSLEETTPSLLYQEFPWDYIVCFAGGVVSINEMAVRDRFGLHISYAMQDEQWFDKY